MSKFTIFVLFSFFSILSYAESSVECSVIYSKTVDGQKIESFGP